ncbi:right-handed parallel beta-helix repeat-containing protein [Paenibacillus sp. GCM10023252]|uniref:right-handed parallel beta-helix repeat-containing protein n=1 Tax=Paenibacillus sp. GCM10023252 TaxID=3252649 RepID=UPI00361DB35C
MKKKSRLSKPRRAVSLFLSLIVSCSLFSFAGAAQAAPATYYVDIDTGVDGTGYGATPEQPYKTIQYAADRTNAGDTVYVMNGTYYKKSDNQSVFQVTRSGSATGGDIKYLAYPGHRPKLKAIDAWNHIIVNASYIHIEGFEIEGDTANLTLQEGEARYNHFIANEAGGTIDWNYIRKTQTNGISIRPASGTTVNPQHVTIKNNIVHDTPGGGIGAEESDYINFENNTVYNTSWYNLYATSGMSILHSVDKDTNTTSYKNVVRNNRVYNNKTLVKWAKIKDYSDGNGIIIDDNQNHQILDKYPAYNGKTLVTNNISYSNGGSGIHAYYSHNVDIVNNTAYQNNTQLNEGEIYANSTDKVKIINNILVASTGKKVNSNYNNTNLTYNYNVYSNGTPEVSGVNDIWADPLFENAAGGDFRLKIGSRAVDKGVAAGAPTNDFSYNPRPRGAGPDRGALENQNLIGNPSFEWRNLGSWTAEQNSTGITVEGTGPYSGTHKAAFSTTAVTKLSQTVNAPVTKTYTVTAHIVTNIASNVKLGADVAGVNKGQQSVAASGGYQKVTFTVSASAGQAIKVWISAPVAAGGWVGMDDVSVQ